ncbi:hypothetical protein B0T26DRAFT_714975 [Lasiosphaeria miniovina]|uniref:Uncharacterized protein n=1 Tax=Lasiosphaeria miniovina TaxID=1954250 RepID=A0AA40ABE9_9PEZI|nr:uncharacterized protein B0T26DRAFT_714975 [Lasiosphaeria miniovina]KAK0712689.1 hypothetical protein B0T26DRAFT_714975 [Lasiosphaeria miniovina]
MLRGVKCGKFGKRPRSKLSRPQRRKTRARGRCKLGRTRLGIVREQVQGTAEHSEIATSCRRT